MLGSFETDLPRFRVVVLGRNGHHRSKEIVRQQVGPDLFVNHLRSLAAQDVHLHRTFDGPYVDLSIPSALEQISDLLPIDRDVENRCEDLKLLDAVVLIASVHCYAPHDEALWVGPVLCRSHSAWLARARPNNDVSLRAALCNLSTHTAVLNTSNDVDLTFEQLANDEIVIK